MFCHQCEQTVPSTGCTKQGVCGKTPQTAALQDLLTYAVRGLSQFAVAGRSVGVVDQEVNRFTVKALFATLTNVDFDPPRLADLIRETVKKRDALKQAVVAAGGPTRFEDPAAEFHPAQTLEGLVAQGEEVGLPIDRGADPDIQSLQETVLYGIRGVAAYADHAAILGEEDDAVYASVQGHLARLLDRKMSLQDWVASALDTGKTNLRAMELLDAGNTGRFGHPQPTPVPLGHIAGKAILISGHDLKDLEDLLKQTEGRGVSVYTHGEMLPAHGYPALKSHKHFFGHYGTAWQNQKEEFEQFPGAILMTTNCLQKPRDSYQDRIFTTGLGRLAGGQPRTKRRFREAWSTRLWKCRASRRKKIAVRSGWVTRGTRCSGTTPWDASWTPLSTTPRRVKSVTFSSWVVAMAPNPAATTTRSSSKKPPTTPSSSRWPAASFGSSRRTLGRLTACLDCSTSDSATTLTRPSSSPRPWRRLSGVGVNDLPLSLILSWYEQKAVAILLTLFHLGIKGIRLGPSLPDFVTPNVLKILVENFDIKPITTVEQDLAACLGT